MACIALPEICISPPPPADPLVEPFSPFTSQHQVSLDDGDGYRASLLSPPPTASPRFLRQSSPLRPTDDPAKGKGLEPERFEALLASTRERNSTLGGKKSPDLRKEIALKAHKSKQMDRRALFLSKVHAPPSPTAAATPKTPPESPAVFHYSLPSPGLVSPLALFEALGQQDYADGITWPPVQPWVEQVDFRMPKEKQIRSSKSAVPRDTNRAKSLPSLDQITAHLSIHGHPPAVKDENMRRRSPIPLPAFLRSSSPPVKPAPAPSRAAAFSRPRATLPIGVNREQKVTAVAPSKHQVPVRCPIPVSPRSPLAPKLEVTTTVVPRTSTMSPTNLTESNLFALNSRARTGRNMMSTLRRRVIGPDDSAYGMTGYDEVVDERKLRRVSAPAELQKRDRCGFAHPVLSMPGGF